MNNRNQTPSIDSQDGKDKLAEHIKSSLAEAQHRYEVQDPFTDGKHLIKTASEIVSKADEIGISRFQGVTADRQYSQISKVNGEWTRDDGKTLAAIQAEIDQQSAATIIDRAQLRAQAGPTVDADMDKKMALADANAFLRIQDPQTQEKAAVIMAEHAQEYPAYKEGLEVAYTGYLRNPPQISPIAAKVYALDTANKEQATGLNTVEHEPERLIDTEDAKTRVNRLREIERQQYEQNQLGQKAEDKRITVENLSEKAIEQNDANRLAERAGAESDYNSQLFTEREKNRQTELMDQVHHQFRVSGNRFHFKDQPNKVAFTDKGQRMVSASNDERVAHAMATMAEAKGWKTIRVSGHPDFQREVWMEASLRGLEVRGFKPQEKDLKELNTRLERTAKNIVEREPDKEQQKGNTAAQSEKTDKHKVVEAVAAEVINKKFKDPMQREAAMKAINQQLDERSKIGKVPTVPMYDKAAPSTTQQPDRARPPVERNAERTR